MFAELLHDFYHAVARCHAIDQIKADRSCNKVLIVLLCALEDTLVGNENILVHRKHICQIDYVSNILAFNCLMFFACRSNQISWFRHI